MVGAIVFTVALLVATAYFLMGGLPLLILKHDVPLDARFVRGFFNVYYRVAFWVALGACVSYLAWGRLTFAAGAAVIAVLSLGLRKHLLALMQRVGERIEAGDAAAVGEFRRVHATALMINLVQLVVLVGGLLTLSIQLT